MKCKQCGTSFEDRRYCPNCGAYAEPEASASSVGLLAAGEIVTQEGLERAAAVMRAANWHIAALICIQIALIFVNGLMNAPGTVSVCLAAGSAAIVLLDWKFLDKLGVTGKWRLWGLFFVPVYLYYRADRTDQRYGACVISAVMYGLIVVAVWSALAAADYSSARMFVRNSAWDNPADFEFALPEYVTTDPDRIDGSVNLEAYIPKEELTLTYAGLGRYSEDAASDTFIMYCIPASDGTTFLFQEQPGTYADSFLRSALYIDENGALAQMGAVNTVWVLPVGDSRRYSLGMEKETTLPYYFTVRTDALGTAEKCLCVLHEVDDGWQKYMYARFYAPDTGEVLAVTNYDDSTGKITDYHVSELLIDIEHSVDIGRIENGTIYGPS